MNNNFEFSYFVPTPDTTANCALSRWNDSLMGLSDFLKAYMSSRQSLEFGFSRNLNIAELLNLAKPTVKDSDNKNDYVINYRKYGDIKANVCGFEIPIVDFLHPFLHRIWLYDVNRNISFDTLYLNGYVCHVFNYNSNLTLDEKIEATIEAFQILRNDVANVMTDSEIAIYFNKNLSSDPRTRSEVLSMIDDVFTKIENMEDSAKNFIFGFKNKKDLDENLNTSQNLYFNDYISLSNTNISLYRDLSCYYALFGYPNTRNFKFNINRTELEYMLNKYIRPHGIDFVIEEANDSKISHNGLNKKQLLVYFKFTMTEKPTVTPFVSHDGTKVPLSKQDISLSCSYQSNQTGYTGMYWLGSYWDENEECPVYYDAEGNPQLMTLENNIDCMGGRDYTIWSSPVQKTENGYQFECCMPLAFYNEASDSYSNEYYATKAHDGVEIGQVMYRVPIVKRMRQNIEEAIVNTHLTKCLSDLVPATNENAEDDETVVLGGVVVDDFTEGLYPVAETQRIANETDYGEVKIVKVKDSEGNDNGVLDLMYHYSETGELSYNDMTMPETGRAIDMITLFDTLKAIGGDNNITDHTFVVNGMNKNNINVQTTGDSSSSFTMNEFNIILNNTHTDTNTSKTYNESIRFMGDGQIYIESGCTTDNTKSVIHTEKNLTYLSSGAIELKASSYSTFNSDFEHQCGFSGTNKFVLLGRYSGQGGTDAIIQKMWNSNYSLEDVILFDDGGTPRHTTYIRNNDSTDKCSITIQKYNDIWSLSPGTKFSTSTNKSDVDLGRDNIPWKNIYADNIVCNTIKPEYPRIYKSGAVRYLNIPIGAILVCELTIIKSSNNTTEPDMNIYAGDRFELGEFVSGGGNFRDFVFYNYHDKGINENPTIESFAMGALSPGVLKTTQDQNSSNIDFEIDTDTFSAQNLKGKFVVLSMGVSNSKKHGAAAPYNHYFIFELLVMKEADV